MNDDWNLNENGNPNPENMDKGKKRIDSASLILSILGVFPGILPCAIIGLVLAVKRKRERETTAAFVLGIIGCVLCAFSILFFSYAATLILPRFAEYRSQAEDNVCESHLRMLESASMVYYAKHEEYPSSPADLVEDGDLQELRECPKGGEYSLRPREKKDGDYGDPGVEAKCSVHGTLADLEPYTSGERDPLE
ncbi:MAG: DUF4190 domain-containing protein [Clostridiales bacterium]|jgi:competence protein ComGC|nr:DUF4190 domain-containing protein [Clostridiales bacterium]